MNLDFYNKVSIVYQDLSGRFVDFNKTYHNGYVIFNKEIYNSRQKQLEFLKQFQEVPFRIFFNDAYLETINDDNHYYNSKTVLETEKTLNVHTEFSMVLFYFLINELKDSLNKFIEVLESDAFKSEFGGFLTFEEKKFHYCLSSHQKIYKFMKDNVENFDLIFHLFNETNSGFLYVTENRMVLKLAAIKDLLETNSKFYDFEKYTLS